MEGRHAAPRHSRHTASPKPPRPPEPTMPAMEEWENPFEEFLRELPETPFPEPIRETPKTPSPEPIRETPTPPPPKRIRQTPKTPVKETAREVPKMSAASSTQIERKSAPTMPTRKRPRTTTQSPPQPLPETGVPPTEFAGRFRHEYKYRINAKQQGVLQVKMAGLLHRDRHVLGNGAYRIRSLYFDDIHDTCLSDNLCGKDPRSKFRVRYYNGDTSRLRLEKKSKYRGMCRKESCALTAEECEKLLRGEAPRLTEDMPPRKKKLLTELELRGLKPKVIVTYERVPFVYSGGNVRVTFDRNLTSSNEIGRVVSGDYAERPIMASGECILEVKWDEVLPRHIKETLQTESLTWTAFSKYAMCRKLRIQ